MVNLKSNGQDFKMNLLLPGYVEDLILARGAWEPHLISELSNRLSGSGIFIDVGANIGYHSLYIASSNPEAICIGFEPHPKIYTQLLQNIKLNALSNVIIHQAAVGSHTGALEFYMQNDSCYNRALSSLIQYEVLNEGVDKIEVPVITLDSFLQDSVKEQVKVLKIDTQGYEYEVIAGAKQLIQKVRPLITFEYHNYSKYSIQETLDLLPDYDVYRIFSWLGGMKPFDEANPEMYVDDLDLLCIPKTKPSSL